MPTRNVKTRSLRIVCGGFVVGSGAFLPASDSVATLRQLHLYFRSEPF